MKKYIIFAVAALLPVAAIAQSVGTYQEDNGTTRNNVGVVVGSGNAATNGSTPPNTAVAVGGRFDNSYPALSSPGFGWLRLDGTGRLQVAPNTSGTAGDGFANNVIGSTATVSGFSAPTTTAGYVFNGTSWDRQRGDANGTVVQPALSSTFWNYAAASGGIVNTTTAVTLRAAGGAGVRNYLCSMTLNHDTLSAATEIVVRDGAAGTVMWRGKLNTTVTEPMSTVTFQPCLRGSANTLMEFATVTAVTGGVYVNAQGYTGI